jgi:hypothetical protein
MLHLSFLLDSFKKYFLTDANESTSGAGGRRLFVSFFFDAGGVGYQKIVYNCLPAS